MTNEPMPRAATPPEQIDFPAMTGGAGFDRPVEGRRISFAAWGAAGLVGLFLWALILKVI